MEPSREVRNVVLGWYLDLGNGHASATELISLSDDLYGCDVAHAARIGAAAARGEILVSSFVKSLVEPSGSVRFGGPRHLDLKGFDGPQPVYAVLWR